MFHRLDHRLVHYAILLGATALLTFPNLGKHSLWDVDEGVNAEAAREMLEAGNWVTPTFNFELRTAKPVFLYWLQATSYSLLGVNEFAARLPSVLAALLSVLVTYELGRRMFGRGTGLMAGLVLASAVEFCMLAHAATPDATLLFFTVVTFYFLWLAIEQDRPWSYVPAGLGAGFAVLTKGPVGVALPGLVALLYFGWNRQLGKLWHRRTLTALAAFLLVALPWYILVALDTRGVWASRFFGRENLLRFLKPMENHSGPLFYHVLGLIVLFAPWSIFLGGTLWYAVRLSRRPPPGDAATPAVELPVEVRATRLLICWFLSYLVFFSVAATKLPNYVLPLYPALGLLTARFLDGWRRGVIAPARWVMPAAIAGLGLVGIVTSAALLIAGGAWKLPFGKVRVFAGLDDWAILGLIPLAGAAAAYLCLRLDRRSSAIAVVATSAVVFVAAVAAFPTVKLENYKAPRELVHQAGAARPDDEVRLGGLFYFEPSLVFYGQREVKKLDSLAQTLDFLSLPYPVYLFVPETVWNDLEPHVMVAHRCLARHFDFLKNCEVLVVTNR
jgi:4-amino-4-deoxy-L-arabinose transferase-like glycosyltransferase